MGFLFGAILLIVFIALISKFTFKTKHKVCPICEEKVSLTSLKCTHCGFLFPTPDEKDDHDQDDAGSASDGD